MRNVTERLMSCGVDVWFAEYKVLPSNYDEFDKNIEKELAEAVECNYNIIHVP